VVRGPQFEKRWSKVHQFSICAYFAHLVTLHVKYTNFKMIVTGVSLITSPRRSITNPISLRSLGKAYFKSPVWFEKFVLPWVGVVIFFNFIPTGKFQIISWSTYKILSHFVFMRNLIRKGESLIQIGLMRTACGVEVCLSR